MARSLLIAAKNLFLPLLVFLTPSFAFSTRVLGAHFCNSENPRTAVRSSGFANRNGHPHRHSSGRTEQLFANGNGGADETSSDSDELLLGAAGTAAGLVTLYSESVLARTGCGLPAGPLGLVGAAEGVSYLGVVAVAAYSIYTKFKTGSGLPAGPYGILGAAEGFSFLAIVVGLGVLAWQIVQYGYIPNAVPMEGGMCQ